MLSPAFNLFVSDVVDEHDLIFLSPVGIMSCFWQGGQGVPGGWGRAVTSLHDDDVDEA